MSEEISFLEERTALVQFLGCKNMGRGVDDLDESAGSPSRRALREASSREPMW